MKRFPVLFEILKFIIWSILKSMQPRQSQSKQLMLKMTQTLTQNSQTFKKERAKNNWSKVRALMSGYKKNESRQISSEPQRASKCLNNNKFRINLFQKWEKILTKEEKEQFIQSSINQGSNLLLVNNCEIIKTMYNCTSFKNKMKHVQLNGPDHKLGCLQDKQNNKHIQQQTIISTYRPTPSFNYLASQSFSDGAIDTTGVWVWQAEEVLSYFLIVYFEIYSPKKEKFSMLELGAGCSGFAALTYAKMCERLFRQTNYKQSISQKDVESSKGEMNETKLPKEIGKNITNLQVVISDGKEENIIYLRKNISQNFKDSFKKQNIKLKGSHYVWGELFIEQNSKNSNESNKDNIQQKENTKFDVILAADCVFFEEYHNQLIFSMDLMLLQDEGVCIFVNPKRGNSVQKFLAKLIEWNQRGGNNYQFKYKQIKLDDDYYKYQMKQSRSRPNFNPDTDQYLFIEVRKLKRYSIEKQEKLSFD